MTTRVSSKIPFVNLHAHSVAGSIFDAIGYPQEHMDFAYQNGCDALALTDHGNMNGLAHQVLHAKKMQAEGKDFKPVFGCEAYFIPSIEEWRSDYEEARVKLKNKKEESQSGTTIEDEDASKKAVKNVLRRRAHLVLVAQNQTGLNNLSSSSLKAIRVKTFIVILEWIMHCLRSIPKVSLRLLHAWAVSTRKTSGIAGRQTKKAIARLTSHSALIV